jgi:hypothetical protein
LSLTTAAASQSDAEGDVTVRLHPVASLTPSGVVIGRARVSCPNGAEVLEAGITMSQDDQQIFGEGFISQIRCNGRKRWHSFQASSTDMPFHRGVAYVSAYVLVEISGGNDTLSAGHTRFIRVR